MSKAQQLADRLLEADGKDFIMGQPEMPTPGMERTITVHGRPAVYRATSCFVYGIPAITWDLKFYDGLPAYEPFGKFGHIGNIYGVNDTHAIYKIKLHRHGQSDVYWGVVNRQTGEKSYGTFRPVGMRFSTVKMELDNLP